MRVVVTRCKNCIYYNAETKGCKRNPSVEAWEESDFCSYGEGKSQWKNKEEGKTLEKDDRDLHAIEHLPKAKWSKWNDTWMCSVCKFRYFPTRTFLNGAINKEDYLGNYCMNCGCEMELNYEK